MQVIVGFSFQRIAADHTTYHIAQNGGGGKHWRIW